MIPLGVLASRRPAAAGGLSFTYTGTAYPGQVTVSPVTATMDIGAASPTRTVVIAVAAKATTNLTRLPIDDSVTIGGVAAVRDDPSPVIGRNSVRIYRAVVPTGTTAEVSIGWAVDNRITVRLYAFVSPDAVTVEGSAYGDGSAGDGTWGASPDSVPGGYVIAAAVHELPLGSMPSVTGAINPEPSGDTRRLAAYGPTAAATAPVVFTTTEETDSRSRIAVVAYGPA